MRINMYAEMVQIKTKTVSMCNDGDIDLLIDRIID